MACGPSCSPALVSAPAVNPYRYGLFSVATMLGVEGLDPRWEACGVQYLPQACATAKLLPAGCMEDPSEKEAGDPTELAYGTPFLVYAAADCDYVGSDYAEQLAVARRTLALGEQRAVEEAFWTGGYSAPSLAGPCDCDSPGGGESPAEQGDPCCVTLNTIPGAEGALSITAAVSALEEYAGQRYGGVPVLHAPRGAAAWAAQAGQLCVCADGARHETALGTPWGFYGGSPNTGPGGEPAPDGTFWMYVTGAVTIRRSEVFTNPATAGEALSRRDNSTFVIAERLYAVTAECLCAAVLVSASCAC